MLARHDEALIDFNRAIELDQDNDWALSCRGDLYRIMGMYPEALAD
jgi:tetratricopeptide (TPR) repeat protein